MTAWASVDQPFRDDREFWASVGRSVDALGGLIVATVLVVVFGRFAVAAYAVPLALLAASARAARVSSARTRPSFATRDEWRQAERRAVAAAIPGAFTRHLHRSRDAVTSQAPSR